MKSLFKIFCLVLFLYGCKSTKTEQLSGFYEQKKVGKPFRQIQLYKDGTFDYHHEYGMSSAKSKGIWTVEDDKIILNTFEDYLTDFFDIAEIFLEEFPQDVFTIEFYNYETLSEGGVTYGSDDKFQLSAFNKIEISKQDLIKNDTIKLHFSVFVLGFNYKIQSFENNYLKINYNPNEQQTPMRVKLENKILKIRNEKLIDNHGNVYKKLN